MKFIHRIKDEVRGNFPDISAKFEFAGDLSQINELPDKPGVYILRTPNCSFVYPWGESNVFYIGMDGVSINHRVVETHKIHMLSAQENKRKGNSIYYPVYEYAASRGAECQYSVCTNKEAWEFEGDLLSRFATVYGAIPVANKKHDDFWHRFPEVEGA